MIALLCMIYNWKAESNLIDLINLLELSADLYVISEKSLFFSTRRYIKQFILNNTSNWSEPAILGDTSVKYVIEKRIRLGEINCACYGHQIVYKNRVYYNDKN